jgi:hypothetical protein
MSTHIVRADPENDEGAPMYFAGEEREALQNAGSAVSFAEGWVYDRAKALKMSADTAALVFDRISFPGRRRKVELA